MPPSLPPSTHLHQAPQASPGAWSSCLVGLQPLPGLPSRGGCLPPTPLTSHSARPLALQRLSPDSVTRSLARSLMRWFFMLQ